MATKEPFIARAGRIESGAWIDPAGMKRRRNVSRSHTQVPVISRFFGIIIAMYYKEHAPPHFHAKYAGQWAAFTIQDMRIIEGHLPPRAVALVLEWAFRHREELLENWRRIERREELLKIAPLD